MEIRRQFEAAREQVAGVVVARELHADVGQQANGVDVGRMRLEVFARDAFRLADLAVAHQFRGLDQFGCACSQREMALLGVPAAGLVAVQDEQVAQRAPGRGILRIEPDRAAQGADRFPGSAEAAQGAPPLVLEARRGRIAGRQGLQYRQALLRPPLQSAGAGEDVPGRLVSRENLQDFSCLLLSEPRVGAQQLRGMVERNPVTAARFESGWMPSCSSCNRFAGSGTIIGDAGYHYNSSGLGPTGEQK